MTTKLVIAAVLCVATLAIAGEKTAPFRHPKAVQAWNRYQFREAKAREAYDREMAAAKTEYTAGLKEAATLAAKAGDADDLKAIAEAQHIQDSANIRFVPIKTTWHEAKKLCDLFGVRMAMPKTETAIKESAEVAGGMSAWIGGVRSGGTWQWIDGTVITGGYWMPGGESAGDYLHVHGGRAAEGRWNGTIAENRMMDGFLIEVAD